MSTGRVVWIDLYHQKKSSPKRYMQVSPTTEDNEEPMERTGHTVVVEKRKQAGKLLTLR